MSAFLYLKKKVLQKVHKRLARLTLKTATKLEAVQERISSLEIADLVNNLSLSNIKLIKNFDSNSISKKSVLILEANDFHGVTLPNYIDYFSTLGYDVHVLVVFGQNIMFKPLCRTTAPYTLWTGTFGDIKSFFQRIDCSNLFDFVFTNTTFFADKRSVFEVLGKVPRGIYGSLMLEHNPIPYIQQFNETYYINERMLFTLAGQCGTECVGCTTIGHVKEHVKNKNFTNFILVGALAKSNRNFDSLFEGVRHLINKGIKNFYITLVGPGSLNLPKDVAPFIHIKGMLPYDQMFDLIEKADFILSMMDYSVEDHRKYAGNWYTGTAILSHSFIKPMLIQRPFAKSYGCTSENSLIYDEIKDALLEAVQMNGDSYQQLTGHLKCKVSSLREQHLNSLKSIIEYREKKYNA